MLSGGFVLEDCLDCLLDLHGGDTFVIFGGSLRHVEIELENVVELVPWVQISETFGNSRIFRSRPLESNSGLWPLGLLLRISILGRMVDDPVVLLFIPDRLLLVLLEVLWGNEVLNNHVLELKLIGQLVDGIKHVVPLPVKVFLARVQGLAGLVIHLHQVVQLLRLKLKLFLDAVEFVLGIQEVILLLFQLLLQLFLLSPFLLDSFLSLLQLFLLLLGDFDGL